MMLLAVGLIRHPLVIDGDLVDSVAQDVMLVDKEAALLLALVSVK